jgi:hypothetical protein
MSPSIQSLRRRSIGAAALLAATLTAPVAFAAPPADQYLPLLTYRVGPYAPSGVQIWAGFLDTIRYFNEVKGLKTPPINTQRHYTSPKVRENNGCCSSSRVNASISGRNQRSGIVGIRS